MNKKRVLMILILLILIISSIYNFTLFKKTESDLLNKILVDLEKIDFLIKENKVLLDNFFKGDSTVYERLEFNHLEIMTYLEQNEKLKVIKLNKNKMLKSEELYRIKTIYLDRMKVNDDVLQSILSSYYDRLGTEVKMVNKNDLTIYEITDFLESGSTFFLEE